MVNKLFYVKLIVFIFVLLSIGFLGLFVSVKTWELEHPNTSKWVWIISDKE